MYVIQTYTHRYCSMCLMFLYYNSNLLPKSYLKAWEYVCKQAAEQLVTISLSRNLKISLQWINFHDFR